MQSASFDTYAHQYDEHFTFSPIGKAQRDIVRYNLMPLLRKDKMLLELNCGTGYDAFELRKYVKSVLATDASPAMIGECEAKFRTGAASGLHFKVMRIQDAGEQLQASNLVFSNFGGLNCLSPSEFKALGEDCRKNLKEGSDLFFVVMGKNCLWERLYFLWKLDSSNAFRRGHSGGVPTRIGPASFLTWYYSPREIGDFFGPEFKIKSCGPVGLFVPPSYLNPFFENRKRLLKLFRALDRIFCKFKWAAGYADHFYIHLKK
jgi:SAM-dependent methyltransferase